MAVARQKIFVPELVRDECLLPSRGSTRYELVLGDEEVEILASGECPESVARQAWQMLGWKRLQARKRDQEKALPQGAV